MAQLSGKVAVVTGGNSGIGLSTAQAFIDQGARVVVFGRNQETLDRAVETLGQNAAGVQGDVTRIDDLDRLFSMAEERFGKIDILFANAGFGEFAPVEATTEEQFDRMFDVNVKGAFFTVQRALPHLNDGASIVLTTSVVNVAGLPNMSVYAATKAAVRSLARTLSADLLPRGIRVNAVSPGPIETPFFGNTGLPQEAIDGFAEQITDQVPLKRFGQPDEIANAVVFLASGASAYMVGSELPVDGGLSQL